MLSCLIDSRFQHYSGLPLHKMRAVSLVVKASRIVTEWWILLVSGRIIMNINLLKDIRFALEVSNQGYWQNKSASPWLPSNPLYMAQTSILHNLDLKEQPGRSLLWDSWCYPGAFIRLGTAASWWPVLFPYNINWACHYTLRYCFVDLAKCRSTPGTGKR